MGPVRTSAVAEEQPPDNDPRSSHIMEQPSPSFWKSAQPEMEASIFSQLFFLWLQPLFSRAAYLQKTHGQALQQADLAPLPVHDHSRFLMEQHFNEAWENYQPRAKKNSKSSKKSKDSASTPVATDSLPPDNEPDDLQLRLRHALWRVVGPRLITAGIFKFFNSVVQFSFPLLLNAILQFLEETQRGDYPPETTPGGVRYKGYWLSCLLLTAIAVKAITESAYFHRVNRCGWMVKAAVSAAVYNKSLRLASSAQHGTTLGEMVNLMQVDASKLEAFMVQINSLWDGLLQIAGYVAILGTLLGWSCLTGLAVMMVATPMLGVVMNRLFAQNRAMVQFTDERVKTTNEALQGIRSVKLYTWETSFAAAVGAWRRRELDCLSAVAYTRGFSRAYMSALPSVAAVCTFGVYAAVSDGDIRASTLFASLVAFDQLRFPLMFYPITLASMVQAKVSLGRVSKFLGMAEITSEGYTRRSHHDDSSMTTNGGGHVEIEHATVYWSDPRVPIPVNGDDTAMSETTRSRKSSSSALQNSEHDSPAAAAEDGLVYPTAVVKDISLNVASGQLCAVIGKVASGKSSLCSAILNETYLAEGSKISVTGQRIAYVAQTAWILNKTIRENILFGMPYQEEKYQTVIQVCQLQHDLAMLDDGDETEIGEQGINLSGGQKQRISIARAAYADADLIIMDDPLSALDPEVAGKVFDECITSFMKGKTRILVTNQLQCLPKCDIVVALGRGRVIEQGTYSDLMNDSRGEVQRLLKDLKTDAEKAHGNSEEVASEKVSAALEDILVPGKDIASLKNTVKAKALTSQEEREIGAVKSQVYFKYIRAGGGFLLFTFVYSIYALSAAVTLLSTAWVSVWTSDSTYENYSLAFYLGVFALMAVLLALVTYLRSYLLTKFGVRASFKLHENLMISVLKAPLSFFDTTPTGRILARFSKDLFAVDQELADFLDIFLFLSLNVFVTIGAIIFVTPYFGIALLPLLIVYIRVLNYFRLVSRETKRLESLSRSPVYSQFSETLGGLSTIRAYHVTEKFVGDFETLLDLSTQAAYCNKAADRWLSTRLEMIGATIAGLAAVFATNVVVSGAASGSGENDEFASLAGLSLIYAIGITGALQFVVRTFAQVEAAMNACERVFYYSDDIAQEAPSTAEELEKRATLGQDPKTDPSSLAVAAAGGKALFPSSDWPSKGEITLNQLFMRYRKETPLVLKGLSVKIGGGQRIGVTGRTGSGKSSLLLCLMRIVEPDLACSVDEYQAPITIDGVDILRVGLQELRSKIGIIPQSPVLFSGTIRSNLDPFDDYTDEQIYGALEKCGMHEAVMAMSGELLAPIAEYGENLSQGQRQLLCLGRALLRQCRILLLDEATSSVDYETDREIQRTLREAFAGCTVITIAHRVNTVMDSDNILVMKDGLACEFGPPQELLQDENSLFADIVRHSGAEEK